VPEFLTATMYGLLHDYLNAIQISLHTAGVAFCRNPDTFNVILTSRFAEEDFEEYLFGNEYGLPKPKEAYSFILIEYPEGEELLA